MDGEQLLDQIAGAVLDSEEVDWATAESTADDAARPFLRHLRLVASVGQLHRRMQPSGPSTSTPGGTANQWGHLRLIESIGRGTFGEVFRAWDTRLDREVALKLIPARTPLGSPGESTLIHEGRLLARVRHPNVVTIYGAEQTGDRIGLWMEFVRGRTLEQLLKDGVAFSTADIVRIGVELSRAVSAVHSAGLLHRDIKTHNVMRADDGRIVLMDFGTGMELDEGSSPDLAGTPLYLAPELFAGRAPTVQSDIYSLGVLLFRLVTKSYPVKGRTIAEVRQAHERGDRIDIRIPGSHVRPALLRVVERACHPHVERRYQTAEALARDLIALQPRSAAVRTTKTIAAAAAIVGLVLLGSALYARLAGNGRTGLASRLLIALTGAPSPLDFPVIVVRPIKNLGDPDDSDFADLITDSIIRVLGRVEGLQVRGLDTSFSLEDAPRNFAAIGQQLGVNLVLEGDVRFSKENLVVHAALMSVTGQQLWSEPAFEYPISSEGDVAAVVDDVARAIVNRLRLKLGPTRMQYEIDLPTLKVLTQARSVREGRGARSLQAIELYKSVIEKFPNHASALGELAAIYGDLGAQFPTAPAAVRPPTASISPDEARRLLLPLARKALDLDDSVAEAHAALGFSYALDLDWDKAEESFERAIDLDPTSSTLRGDYALTVLVPKGELNKAIQVLKDALEDDPGSLDLRRLLARVQLNLGQFAEALKNCQQVLAQDPTFPFVSNFAAWAQLHLGEKAAALAWFEKYYVGDDGREGTLDDRGGVKGWIHAINGNRAEAEKIAEMPLFKVLPLRRVEIYGLLGDAEKTLDALEEQVELNPLRAASYLTYPELHFLKGSPRFEALRERLTDR